MLFYETLGVVYVGVGGTKRTPGGGLKSLSVGIDIKRYLS